MEYTTVAKFIEFVGSSNMDDLMNEYSGASAILSRQTQILNLAEDRINGYAAKLYAIPLPASYAMEDLTLQIARYNLYTQMEGDDVPTRIKTGYEKAIEQCKEIQSGVWKPPPDTDGTGASASASGSSYDIESVDTVFDDDDMEYF